MEIVTVAIKFIFNNSSQFNVNLFRTLLDMLFSNAKCMVFDPNLITSVCQTSGLLNLGALLLEEYLNNTDDTENEMKRSRGFENGTKAVLWVKLAE